MPQRENTRSDETSLDRGTTRSCLPAERREARPGTSHYTTLRYVTLRYFTLRYVTLRYGTLRYVTLRYVALRYVTLRYVTLRYVTLRYVTLRYAFTLRYVTLRYVTLHYITLHYVTLRYITSHYITCVRCLLNALAAHSSLANEANTSQELGLHSGFAKLSKCLNGALKYSSPIANIFDTTW